MITPDRIEAAARGIDPVFLRSPLLGGTSLDRALGLELHLKVECLNPIRAFKGRGTDWFVADVEGTAPLVGASAGNFGQGLARAGRKRGRAVTVFAAQTANPLKLDAMRRLGADVRLSGHDFDAAKLAARAHAAETGARLVEDGAEPAIAEGAGTIALEITGAGVALDAALISLGNGALATGMGAWLRHAAPETQVIGVVAAGAPSMRLSFEAGRAVPTSTADTIADGIAVREPVPFAVECMTATLDAVVAVEDATIRHAMRLLHEHVGLVVEPAGAAGLAALLMEPDRWRGRRVGTVLCGGNVSPEQLRAWLA